MYIYPFTLADRPTVWDLDRSPIRKTVLVNLRVSGTVDRKTNSYQSAFTILASHFAVVGQNLG